MCKTPRLLLAVGLLALSAVLVGWADPPPPQRVAGRVLLLENDRALEGDIQRVGQQYRIRRDVGEVWVPVDKSYRLCADWNEAYEVLKLQANLHDVDERLRLARWCSKHNLAEQGLAEVQAVLKARPQHGEAKHLLNLFQRTLETPTPVAMPAAATLIRPTVDLGAESLALFNTRIQPILMNACAGCHATGRGGDFKLTRCLDGQANRKATQDNLAALMSYLRADQPENSPLLVKAISLHGNSTQPPLPGRASTPFKTLNDWVVQVVASNPHLRKEMGGAVVPVTAKTSAPVVPISEVQAPRPLPPLESKTLTVAESSPPTRVQPERQTEAMPTDEFDALLFNRQWHSQKK